LVGKLIFFSWRFSLIYLPFHLFDFLWGSFLTGLVEIYPDPNGGLILRCCGAGLNAPKKHTARVRLCALRSSKRSEDFEKMAAMKIYRKMQ